MGDGGNDSLRFEVGCQKCGIQITLDGAYPTGTYVKPLIEWFLGIGPTTVTVLRQFGGARWKLVQGAAGTRNRASQVVYQHPWGT